ncbi:MAG: hypothetical protein AAF215_21250 [Cyanobacteria bacterium P01_A01_bin.123]
MEQTLITQDFAILAPVPEQHLVTGLEAIAPPSTKNDAPTWAIFWLVQDLIELREPILVSDFQGLGKKTAYASRFIPEGPLLVEHPGLIAV